MSTVLSPDMRAQMPRLELKTKTLRSHKETMVHPIFKWIKQEIEVIDQLEFVGIVVTQMGRSFEIPLSMLHEDEKEDNGE